MEDVSTGIAMKSCGIAPTTSYLIDSGGTFETPTPWLIKHYVKDHLNLHQEHIQKGKKKCFTTN